ncbi:universal stress protein [Actinomadura nitritigenes]|uniref:Universal stress protein n=1 Tax=Actinomadura nitritigenes TaxID=134602 RepID=A0ABS3RFS1_9ACTN|nr:universal stress protein [Actinomadura nitritigenes]MBO2445084.1 universal stress protein [Actinomadura nitritigenes]
MDRRCVLAGFDGSRAAGQAVRWAAVEAAKRGASLRVCHAWNWPYPVRPEDEAALAIVRAMGAMVLDEGVRIARETAPDLDIAPLLLKGSPPGVLLDAGAKAELTVIGNRGSGGFDALPLGSTAAQVPAHADRPVVVVPAGAPHPRPAGAARVVVGVDGSPAGDAALRFALREAGLHGATVTAICAWWDPAVLPSPDRLPFTDPEKLKEQAKARFEATVAHGLAGCPEVAVERRFVMERAQRVLADNARGASLLVVGDRGIGSSPRTLLGAVTRAVLHEAPAPVAIVPEPGRRPRRPG